MGSDDIYTSANIIIIIYKIQEDQLIMHNLIQFYQT